MDNPKVKVVVKVKRNCIHSSTHSLYSILHQVRESHVVVTKYLATVPSTSMSMLVVRTLISSWCCSYLI